MRDLNKPSHREVTHATNASYRCDVLSKLLDMHIRRKHVYLLWPTYGYSIIARKEPSIRTTSPEPTLYSLRYRSLCSKCVYLLPLITGDMIKGHMYALCQEHMHNRRIGSIMDWPSWTQVFRSEKFPWGGANMIVKFSLMPCSYWQRPNGFCVSFGERLCGFWDDEYSTP